MTARVPVKIDDSINRALGWSCVVSRISNQKQPEDQQNIQIWAHQWGNEASVLWGICDCFSLGLKDNQTQSRAIFCLKLLRLAENFIFYIVFFLLPGPWASWREGGPRRTQNHERFCCCFTFLSCFTFLLFSQFASHFHCKLQSSNSATSERLWDVDPVRRLRKTKSFSAPLRTKAALLLYIKIDFFFLSRSAQFPASCMIREHQVEWEGRTWAHSGKILRIFRKFSLPRCVPDFSPCFFSSFLTESGRIFFRYARCYHGRSNAAEP